MTLAVWPSELPQSFSRQGFTEAFADGRLSTKADAGPPKSRRRFSSAIRQIQAAIDVPVDGKMRLLRFWNEDTASGSLPFLVPDPTCDGVGLIGPDGLQLLDQDGRPILSEAWWLAMFGEAPPSAVNTAGAWYRITFTLSVLP